MNRIELSENTRALLLEGARKYLSRQSKLKFNHSNNSKQQQNMKVKMEEKLGVALVKRACPLCGKAEDGESVMNTRLTKGVADKVKALHGQVVGYTKKPCDDCADMMSKGFLLIGVDEAKTEDRANPYRTGRQWVITHDAARRAFPAEFLKRGAGFITTEASEKMGLPANEEGGQS